TQLRMRIDLLLHLVEVRTDGIGQSVCSSRRKVRSRRLPCGVIGAENEMQGQVVKCPRWIGKLRVIPLAVGEWSETGSNNLGLRIDGTDCLTERERARPDVAYCFVADLPMAVELVAQFVDNVTFMMRVNVADPIGRLFRRAAAHIQIELRYGADEITELQELIRAKLVVFRNY